MNWTIMSWRYKRSFKPQKTSFSDISKILAGLVIHYFNTTKGIIFVAIYDSGPDNVDRVTLSTSNHNNSHSQCSSKYYSICLWKYKPGCIEQETKQTLNI